MHVTGLGFAHGEYELFQRRPEGCNALGSRAWWPMSEARRILGHMDGNARRVDGAVLADCLYLIGQAWVKLKTGDGPGAGEDLAAADRIAPKSAVRSIIWMIGRELPEPRPGPGGMDAWLEACRRAGAGELELTRV